MARVRFLMVLVAVGALAMAGCGEDTGGEGAATETTVSTNPSTTITAPPAGGGAAVLFTVPAEGAKVISPVKVKMLASNFTIEPAGEVKPGAGHFHIIVDAECTPVGQVIPQDDTHLHYGMGQTEAELPLPAGKHTLCLQAGDGAHTALDLTDEITIDVQPSGY